MTSYAPGVPSWVDLMTSDPAGARAFYGGLFGWEFEIGAPDTGHYTQAMLRGKAVAGIAGEPAPSQMPTAWTTYLASHDVETDAKRVTEAGGTIMMGPMDVMQFGRMLVAADVTGAVFGIWQGGTHIGAQLVNEPGAINWNELSTRDLAAAQGFYTKVFGYEWESVDTGEGGPSYLMFKVDGRPAGGALQMDESFPADVPSSWMVYFAVADADDCAARVRDLGGSVMRGPVDSAFGRWSLVRDPQGGTFMANQMPAGMA